MNEKFLQLAKQAGFVIWSDEDWKPKGAVIDWSSDYDEDLEKFAELIVSECAKRSAELGQSEIGLGLLKHFGVEE